MATDVEQHSWGTDPRLANYVRTIHDDEGTVHLVGIVHDHPASVYRARTVVAETRPNVVALEVSSLAHPLFEQYAADSHEPPRFGGEYSAAIQAAQNAKTVGIDGPSPAFVSELATRSIEQRASLPTVRQLMAGVVAASREAFTYRMAATLSANTPFTVNVEDEPTYVDTAGDPQAQAEAERATVEQLTGLLESLERPPAVRLRDESREACMVKQLQQLRTEGTVVAVIGVGHLDPVANSLHSAS